MGQFESTQVPTVKKVHCHSWSLLRSFEIIYLLFLWLALTRLPCWISMELSRFYFRIKTRRNAKPPSMSSMEYIFFMEKKQCWHAHAFTEVLESNHMFISCSLHMFPLVSLRVDARWTKLDGQYSSLYFVYLPTIVGSWSRDIAPLWMCALVWPWSDNASK